MIAAAGADRSDVASMGEPSFASTMSSMASGTSFSSATTLVPDRTNTSTPADNGSVSQKRVERMHSGKTSRSEHRHHPSSSRHHQGSKTVGEYALHVLFTSVSSSTSTPSHDYQ